MRFKRGLFFSLLLAALTLTGCLNDRTVNSSSRLCQGSGEMPCLPDESGTVRPPTASPTPPASPNPPASPTPPSSSPTPPPSTPLPPSGPTNPNVIEYRQDGQVFLGTVDVPRTVLELPQFANQSFKKVEVNVDVYISDWNRYIQGRSNSYEIFTLLNDKKYFGHALGFVHLVASGNSGSKVDLLLNSTLNATTTFSKISKRAPNVVVRGLYHFRYLFDGPRRKHSVWITNPQGVLLSAALDGDVNGSTFNTQKMGFRMPIGGYFLEEGPDRTTEGWEWTNLLIRAEKN